MQWRLEDGLDVVVPDAVLASVEAVVGGAGVAIDSYRDSTLSAEGCRRLAPVLDAARGLAEGRVRTQKLAELGLSRPAPWAEPQLARAIADDDVCRTFEGLAELCRLAASEGRSLQLLARG